MVEKTLQSRIVQKHDTSANWAKATNFKPKAGEIIVYDDLNKIKIGNGTALVSDLPFTGAGNTLKLTGDVTGSASFNASGNVTITATVADDSHNHTIANVDGLQNALNGKASTATATTSANGLMSSSDKGKLNGIANGAEVNQNAFSKIVVGSNAILADSKTDSFTLVAGSNVTLTPDGDQITIAAKDTTSLNIGATATDDDVVILTGTAGTNSVTYDAKHATKGPSTSGSTTKGATANTTISGSGATGSIKIPKVTVDKYGHTTGLTDYTLSLTMPTIPGALKNPSALTVGSKSYDGSSAVSISAADLGLSGAMRFLGTSETAISDDDTTNPITIGSKSTHVAAGNVVLYGAKEFVWTGSAWEELGNEGSYKIVQAAVASPSASGSTTAFIDTISQDTNGKITVTKKNVATATTSAAGLMSAGDKTKLNGLSNYTLPVATASTLGGIKSGGDITINADGIIAIKDDSHNHVISNIDGLQSALNAKAAKSTTVTATLSAASWQGAEAPYSYELAVNGVTATSNQEILPSLDITGEQLTALQSTNLQDGGQAANSITLKAFGTKPTIDIPIRIILRKDA